MGEEVGPLPKVPNLARRALVLSALLSPLWPLRPVVSAPLPTVSRFPSTSRTVAVGDIHGDFDALLRVLRLARVVDARTTEWCGGDTTLVLIGDVLDRGSQERECLELIRQLKVQARAAGGRCITLLGNHEVLNVAGITIYASEAGQAQFGKSRADAFRPGGELANEYAATWPVACIVGDTAFVHGGLTPSLSSDAGLDAVNAAAVRWLRAEDPLPPKMLLPFDGSLSPLWTREIGEPAPTADACSSLGSALASLGGVKRVVVGHTVQEEGITSACDERVWRIDVGLSGAMRSAPPQALEVARDGSVRILGERR